MARRPHPTASTVGHCGLPGEWVTSSQAYGNFLPEVNRLGKGLESIESIACRVAPLVLVVLKGVHSVDKPGAGCKV